MVQLYEWNIFGEIDLTGIDLMSNAMKFTRDEGHATVTVTGLPDRARVEVTNDGIEIPAAMVPHVFERFTRARRPGLREEGVQVFHRHDKELFGGGSQQLRSVCKYR